MGFGDDEYISITREELYKAIKAQINGGVVIFSEGSVDGNKIISITPDWNRALGLKRGYKLQSEDYDRIGLDMSQEASLAIEEAKNGILGGRELLGGGKKEIGDGNK